MYVYSPRLPEWRQRGGKINIEPTSAHYRIDGHRWLGPMSEVCSAKRAVPFTGCKIGYVANRLMQVMLMLDTETAQRSESCLTPELHCA